MERRLVDEVNLSQRYLDLMAHDINNYNQTILGYLELTLDVVKSDEAKKYIQEAIGDVKKSAELIRNVKKAAIKPERGK